MKIKYILTGVFLLGTAIGTNHLFLLLAMLVGVLGVYLYVRNYKEKQHIPREWKTTAVDTVPILHNIGTENVGFSRERYSDDTRM